ncbi:hypothetical protein E8E12_011204 [Didymella heteroderae]|uniref:Uncharacterized protein n=1 Tax=Didymella heteroderae TaxID=1769908 RepID=A0A9P4WY13_9PLEO|nr:hypothetical protein E8E12_011204 [Didymella heteroderae]
MQPGFTLAPRDPFADAKQTLSSWDNCMAKDYCKWPVIVAIIVGGIIAFSVVFCIARCLCCAAECTMCCCKCCTCCCGSGDSGHKRMKSENQGYPPPQPYPQQPYASPNPYAEARSFAPPPPPPPQINTQYQSHATPVIARQPSNPHFNPQVNPKFARPASPERPQYATFDAHSKPANEDALPAMPSWNDARSRQIEVEEEAVPEKRGDVEMERLNHNGSVPNTSVAGVAAGAVAGGMRASPGPGRSPVSPAQGSDSYGFPAAYQSQYDRRGSPAQNQNVSPVYGANAGYASNNYNHGPSPAQSHSQYSQASDPYERRSPPQNQPYNQPYNNTAQQNTYTAPPERYNSPAPPSYHTTANPNPYAYAPAPVQPYDQPRSNTPGYGAGSGNAGYDPVPNRGQTATPSTYPGQQQYQAFQPQGAPQGQQYSGITRKPVEGSLRDV